MQKVTKYTIFQTKWGYFGLAGTEYGLCRTQLPGSNPEKIKTLLLKNLPAAQFDKTFCKILQEQITAYFECNYVQFSQDIPLILDRFSSFSISVLKTCREIEKDNFNLHQYKITLTPLRKLWIAWRTQRHAKKISI